MNEPSHVVIVGASLAGTRTALALRREGYAGVLTIIGDEHHEPYDRPPLSKQVLQGKWGVDKATLLTPEAFTELNATWILGDGAVALDVGARCVTLASGRVVQGDVIVIATGTRARRLPFTADRLLHTVRTSDDATTLARALDVCMPGAVVAVIGAGFIGAEVATALKLRELTPVVFESQPRPLDAILGSTAATWLEQLPGDFGVTLHTGASIADVRPDGVGVVLDTNSGVVSAALAVLGVGAVVNTEWLDGAGLALEHGVMVSSTLEAAPGIYAVGDVARFPLRIAGDEGLVRIEHWQVANDHASYVARHVVGLTREPFTTVPYFWSDQYGKKIQMLGHPSPTDDVRLVQGSVGEGKWLAHYERRGVVTGVLALNNPRELMLSKPLLETTT